VADDAASRARAEPAKRLTRQWRVKMRFAVARRVGTAVGLLLAIGMIVAGVTALPDPRAALGGGFLLQAAVLLAAGGGLPWVVIGALAGWAERRYW
jgi:hypothetical protein